MIILRSFLRFLTYLIGPVILLFVFFQFASSEGEGLSQAAFRGVVVTFVSAIVIFGLQVMTVRQVAGKRWKEAIGGSFSSEVHVAVTPGDMEALLRRGRGGLSLRKDPDGSFIIKTSWTPSSYGEVIRVKPAGDSHWFLESRPRYGWPIDMGKNFLNVQDVERKMMKLEAQIHDSV